MFGISGGEFLVILLVAALVLGPRNLAQALRLLKSGLQKFQRWSQNLRQQSTVSPSALGIRQEDIDILGSFDSRELDPRRMIRDAVQEELQAWLASAEATQTNRQTTSEVSDPSPQTYLTNQKKGDPS